MNLVEQLLKADAKKADELATGTFESNRLARLLGLEEAVEVSIQEIPSRRMNELAGYTYDGKGNFQFEKSYDANLMACTEGITEPNLRDKDLQRHFGTNNASQLCEKLFGSEVSEIADAIAAISGYAGEENKEEAIKN